MVLLWVMVLQRSLVIITGFGFQCGLWYSLWVLVIIMDLVVSKVHGITVAHNSPVPFTPMLCAFVLFLLSLLQQKPKTLSTESFKSVVCILLLFHYFHLCYGGSDSSINLAVALNGHGVSA